MAGHARAGFFVATLNGEQEVPPTVTTGMGSATVFLDTVHDSLTVNLSFSGLLGPETGASINGPAPPGSEASSSLYALDVHPPGDFSGTVTNQMIAIVALGSYTVSQQIADLESGLWYINVQSAIFFEGEIRGQLVPEPNSLVMAFVGLAGLIACGYRFRQV
jgi:hypothetical protein